MVNTTPICPEDEPFLCAVYASTRQAELAGLGWPAAQMDAFLSMQFAIQQRSYALQYPGSDQRLILHETQRAGRLIVARSEHEILLVDIALLPEFRSLGLGTTLLRALQQEAGQAGKPLRLRVMKTNPAQHLYERLGWVKVGENDMHYAMEWRFTA
jgi:ribosomal protein S18 acetylase RimI-like enzyme